MGEEGEDTSWKSFTERFQRGSGQSSRSPMAAHGEERGEVEKKERRRKKRACTQTGIRSRALGASLAPYSVPRALARVAPFRSYVVRLPSSWTD
jgi:hypothetical protein